MTIKRPPVALSLVLYPSGGAGAGADASAISGTHSADTTRRGFPSIRTRKSAGVRPGTGLPLSSTTVTSSDVTSTDDWKLGFAGCCADDGRPQRTQTTQRQNRILFFSPRTPRSRRLQLNVICPPRRGNPAARERRG